MRQKRLSRMGKRLRQRHNSPWRSFGNQKQDSLSLGLKQPGGVMYIDANWKDSCLYSLTLTVRVKIVAAGTAYLESF